MKKPISLRLEVETIKWLKSQGELPTVIRNAIRLYREGPRTITTTVAAPSEKKAVDKYRGLKEYYNAYPNTRCTQCNALIPLGQPFLWGKDQDETIRVCINCRSKAESDPKVYRRGKKLREIEAQIREGRRELKQIDVKINMLEPLNAIHKKLTDAVKREPWGAQELLEVRETVSELKEIWLNKYQKPLQRAKPLRECRFCRKEFEPYKGERYCSDKCRRAKEEQRTQDAEERRADYKQWYQQNMAGPPPGYDPFR